MTGTPYPLVPERIGPPCATIEWTDLREVPAWLSERLDLFQAGKPTLRATREPLKFYGLRRAAKLLETSWHKAKALMGEPDALFLCGLRQYPVWNHANLTAAWRLINDAKLSGDKSFEPRVCKRKPKPRKPPRIFNLSRRPKVSRVRFVQAVHRWADPRAVAACRVSKEERELLRK